MDKSFTYLQFSSFNSLYLFFTSKNYIQNNFEHLKNIQVTMLFKHKLNTIKYACM